MRLWLLILVSVLCFSCSTAPKEAAPLPTTESPSAAIQDPMKEHLVRIHIPLSGTMPNRKELEDFAKLEDALGYAVVEAGVGELDGNEMGGGEYTIWLYGADAARLAEVATKVLKDKTLPKGTHLFLRHGGVKDEQAKEETITLVK